MNGEQKRVTISIYGNQYAIVTDESYESLAELSLMIETSMREIESKTHNENRQTLAILAALKYAHMVQLLTRQNDDAEKKHDALLKHIDQTIHILTSCL